MVLKKALIISFTLSLLLWNACNSPAYKVSQPNLESSIAPVDMVYPQLDTENSRWFLFTSASRPFGMVNLSPDTQLKGTWGSGYRYEIDTIKGFSHIHGWQLSGLSVMPIVIKNGTKNIFYKDFYSKFSHDSEKVSPGYHSVHLNRYNTEVEITSTKRTGIHRYTFPKNTQNAVLFNLNAQLGPCKTQEGVVTQINENQLNGQFVVAPTKRKPKPNTIFFHVELNTPVSEVDSDSQTGNYMLHLEKSSIPVLMKIGISYTSVENAKNNLDTELPHWDFDKVVDESKEEWNNLLSRITVEGATYKDRRRFYTDLWHALQGRRIISDINGAYPDNTQENFRIGQLPLKEDGTPAFNHYNSDSFWGAQWTINTLWGLVYPEIKEEFVHSLLQYKKDGGLIPRGPSGGNYTYVMTGASSTPFIVSAIQQGLVTENLDTIYSALKKNHILGGIMEKAGYEHETNLGGGLSHYLKNGYVPYPIPEGKFGIHQDGASLTLEYAYQDFVLAQLAKKLNHEEDYTHFMERSQNYKNVYDSSTGWMRPKNLDGIWKEDFDPYLYENGFNESNGAQSTWFVPHDLKGLAYLMGGTEKAIEKLNTQFINSEAQHFTAGSSHDREMHPEYSRIPINYGNQPSMQTAQIFTKLGRPDLSQYWSRKVVKSVFSGLSPSTGYSGDEDQGLMGSLAVLMKIGMFQMNGGVMENPKYEIGSPIFDKITIQLNNDYYPGEKLEIKTINNSSENMYIDKIQWNGEQLNDYHIFHHDVIKGGTLELKMVASKPIE
ncbi:GH92 family glycosyl hydrolase [Flagellimonas eckloniae]|uniref:Alpha-mannosidase n=1 Tax=Flagellimonas eckloniae TaxID=346185 RepID=A0A0N8WFS9_9FLAO|nr:GH92 family glycosyl hydrolase [Allomuricauda eckloniae]KQC29547.1 alpha-mannosidase [Allomuricauda eckloniae]